MSDFLSNWIGSVAAACLISGLALAITPKGKVQRVLKTVCGILVVVAVISPFTDKSGANISLDWAQYRETSQELSQKAQEENTNLSEGIIAGKLEEYILDKAPGTGVALDDVQVKLTAGEDGTLYPSEVSLCGSFSQGGKSKLSAIIESDIGVSSERQSWVENENN